jgi:hypothetical protein
MSMPESTRAIIDRVLFEAEVEKQLGHEPRPGVIADALKRNERLDQIEEGLSAINAKLEAIANPPERRSQMSPAEKSRIIRTRGLAAYNAIPW